MPYLRKLAETKRFREKHDGFRGYDHNLRIGDDEFFDTENLSSDFSPVLSTRKKRFLVAEYENPGGIISKSALAVVAGGKLYYNGVDMSGMMPAVSITSGEKQLLSMGAYLIILPDGIYFNTERPSDSGYINNTRSYTGEITYSLSDREGNPLTPGSIGSTAPQSPQNGDLWLDTSDEAMLKTYSEADSAWLDYQNACVKLTAPGIGRGFSALDFVTVSGSSVLTGEKLIEARGENFIVLAGIVDGSKTLSESVTVSRQMPEMDFVTECGNRLWGCHYGVSGGNTVNEIYCSALGDFKNWRRYLGLSTDSWAATVGTDGRFTGAATHRGCPVFFKENCLHRVIPSSVGAHQIQTLTCPGIEQGSARSAAVIDEVLYYKSAGGIYRYDGSLPEKVSQALGDIRYRNAAAGNLGSKYYISMENLSGEANLFVYDTEKRLWMREDETAVLSFASSGSDLFFITFEGALYSVNGSAGTPESEISWFAETGDIGFDRPDKKYLSRINLSLSLSEGAFLDAYIRYDGEPEFEHIGHIDGEDMRSFSLPLFPRRCDRFRLRLEGTGEMKLYSRTDTLEIGSDCG